MGVTRTPSSGVDISSTLSRPDQFRFAPSKSTEMATCRPSRSSDPCHRPASVRSARAGLLVPATPAANVINPTSVAIFMNGSFGASFAPRGTGLTPRARYSVGNNDDEVLENVEEDAQGPASPRAVCC